MATLSSPHQQLHSPKVDILKEACLESYHQNSSHRGHVPQRRDQREGQRGHRLRKTA
jgi:hypothetical protein